MQRKKNGRAPQEAIARTVLRLIYPDALFSLCVWKKRNEKESDLEYVSNSSPAEARELMRHALKRMDELVAADQPPPRPRNTPLVVILIASLGLSVACAIQVRLCQKTLEKVRHSVVALLQ